MNKNIEIVAGVVAGLAAAGVVAIGMKTVSNMKEDKSLDERMATRIVKDLEELMNQLEEAKIKYGENSEQVAELKYEIMMKFNEMPKRIKKKMGRYKKRNNKKENG